MTQTTLTPTAQYPRLSTLEDVTAACAAHPEIQPYARQVGRWVWCEFPSKPSDDARDFLKGTGFRWNKERAAWQHPCGHYCRRNTKIDPRAYYGQSRIEGGTVMRDEAGPRPAPTMQRDHDRLSAELANFQTA